MATSDGDETANGRGQIDEKASESEEMAPGVLRKFWMLSVIVMVNQ